MQRRGSVNGNAASARIRVAVRMRPPDYKIPKDEVRPPCVAPSSQTTAQNVVEFRHDAQAKSFTFDHVFGGDALQDEVYASALQPLMAQFLDGYNVTVMAYGQTGSGKTHTMGNKVTVFNTTPTTSPCRDRSSSIPTPTISTPETRTYHGSDDDGLMPRFLNDLFVNLKKEPSMREIRVTFVEIYLDTIRDLLDDRVGKTLAIREDAHNVWVDNLRSVQVETLTKALEVLNAGRARQTVGKNALNDESSRSHAVYTMEVSRKFQSEIKKSKVTFVDLAGSERTKKTEVEGMRLRESIHINMGLSTLGNVINALAEERRTQRRNSQDTATSRPTSPDTHIPYRSSKLTRLLRDGLGGNARTLIIACVSSLYSNAEETMNTLQFANRARSIQNKAEKNVHHDLLAVHPSPSELEVARLQEDIKRLQQQISELEGATKHREEEIGLAEQARTQRKEKKRDDRRDAEMTTEITIHPQIDAHTQHEGESTEEGRLSCVDAVTMTDAIEDAVRPPQVKAVDASIQFGPLFSESSNMESMTDSEPAAETSETGTFCDLLTSPTVDSAIQFGTSYLHFQDIETTTDPLTVVETCDVATESVVENVDPTCLYDIPVAECVDVGLGTDSQPVIANSDASTECAAVQLLDADCQHKLSTVDASTVTEDDSASDLVLPASVDTSTQYDAAMLVDVAIYTDAVATRDVSTEYLKVVSADIACQSDVAIVESTDVSTDCQPAGESVDASTDSLLIVIDTADEACQSEFMGPQGVDVGMTTDPVPAVATATASTECDDTDMTKTACQCDVACSVDVGVISERCDSSPSFDNSAVNCIFGTADTVIQSKDADRRTENVPIAEPSKCARPEINQDRIFNSFGAEGSGANAFADVGSKSCRFPASSTSSLSVIGNGIKPIDVPAATCTSKSPEAQKPQLDGDSTMVESEVGMCSKLASCLESPAMKLSNAGISSILFSPEAITAAHEVYQVARIEATGDCSLELLGMGISSKISRAVTPEATDDDPALSTCSLSENQLEVDHPAGHEMFGCSPSDDDDDLLDDWTPTTRGISEADTIVFASSDPITEYDEHANLTAIPPPSPSPPTLPLALSLSVKPPTIPAHPTERDIVDKREEERVVPMLPPAADFVVVRSPRCATGLQSGLSKRTKTRHQAVQPLRMFAFDDDIAMATPEKTAVQAKHLYENLRQMTRDEFGYDTDDAEQSCAAVSDAVFHTVGQLMTETNEFIQRRQKRQQRIAHLRGRITKLEDLLHVEHRAPISEPELSAYADRVQEEFLLKLSQQLITLAAKRLSTRLEARIEAEQLMPLPSDDGPDPDSSCPFLSLDQCHACAEWFFHRPDDAAFFEKQILPLITSGWIALSPRALDAEHVWFQL